MLRSTRRGFLSGLIGLVAAPAVVKATSLMPIFVPKPALRWACADAMPPGWVQCDGGLLRKFDYPELFNLIGNQFGGDGVMTFAVPDRRIPGRHYPEFVQAINTRWENGHWPGVVRPFLGPRGPTPRDTRMTMQWPSPQWEYDEKTGRYFNVWPKS